MFNLQKDNMFGAFLIVLILLVSAPAIASQMFFVAVDTPSREDRVALISMGFDIDGVDIKTGHSYLRLSLEDFRRLQDAGFSLTLL